MDFERWIAQVSQILAEKRSDITSDRLDANAMYQAFANGVSPEVFASVPALPLKTQSSSLGDAGQPPSFQILNSELQSPTPPPPLSYQMPVQGPPVKGDPSAHLRKRGIGPIGIAATFLSAIFLLALIGQASSPSDSVYSAPRDEVMAPTAAPTPPPLNDEQKVAQARLALSAWKGDLTIYEENVAILRAIPNKSTASKDAQALFKRWEQRKKEADARQAREARHAEKRRQKEEREAALAAIKRAKEEMRYFTGEGDVKVAVGNVELKKETDSHVATGNAIFVYLFIAVKNEGTETIHANPNDFTLADSKGNTTSHETDTYSLNNHLDAVNLTPGQQTSGWLIFLLPKDKEYILTRTGGFGVRDVSKTIIP